VNSIFVFLYKKTQYVTYKMHYFRQTKEVGVGGWKQAFRAPIQDILGALTKKHFTAAPKCRKVKDFSLLAGNRSRGLQQREVGVGRRILTKKNPQDFLDFSSPSRA
jgi:hypothetical protein